MGFISYTDKTKSHVTHYTKHTLQNGNDWDNVWIHTEENVMQELELELELELEVKLKSLFYTRVVQPMCIFTVVCRHKISGVRRICTTNCIFTSKRKKAVFHN